MNETKKRNMYILMDLVVNHCSDEHEWFRKACEDPEGKYGNFFYLRDKKEGELPTNWRSYFGGQVWEDLPGTNKQYLHVFHKKQTDLNWENPEVREEVYKNINWWLDKGLGGFRIDAIINIKKALPLRSYAPDREDGLCSIHSMLQEATGIGTFLEEMRDRTFQKYDAFTVGEVFDEKPEEIQDFIGDNGYFSSIFDFNEALFGGSEKGWYDAKPITPDDYKKCCFEAQAKVKNIGFLSNIIENHDEPSGVSRYIPEGDCCIESKKMLAALNFMLRGLPFIYQGQELGMENAPISSIDEVDDISALNEYENAQNAGLSPDEALKVISRFSRDNARTPMQWSDEANAGFTTGTPWLKVNPNYVFINAKAQITDSDSVFNFYKQLIALRKSPVWHNLMAYYRKGDKTLLIVGNYQKEEQDIVLPAAYKNILLNNYADIAEENLTIRLYGYQVLIFEMEQKA